MKSKRKIDTEWGALLDVELKRLPSIQAPPQLMTSVLREARIRAARPWWRQSFWCWPPVVRALALAWLLSLGSLWMWTSWIGVGTLATWVQSTWSGLAGQATWLPWLSSGNLPVESQTSPLAAFLQSPWFIAGLLFTGLLYLTCVAAGSALFRLVFHQTPDR